MTQQYSEKSRKDEGGLSDYILVLFIDSLDCSHEIREISLKNLFECISFEIPTSSRSSTSQQQRRQNKSSSSSVIDFTFRDLRRLDFNLNRNTELNVQVDNNSICCNNST